jgi:hypothetical protein
VAILRAGWPRIGLTGVQVQVDGGEVAGAEEVGPEVGIPLGHDHRVVAEDLLQLFDGASGEDPVRGEGVRTGYMGNEKRWIHR